MAAEEYVEQDLSLVKCMNLVNFIVVFVFLFLPSQNFIHLCCDVFVTAILHIKNGYINELYTI